VIWRLLARWFDQRVKVSLQKSDLQTLQVWNRQRRNWPYARAPMPLPLARSGPNWKDQCPTLEISDAFPEAQLTNLVSSGLPNSCGSSDRYTTDASCRALGGHPAANRSGSRGSKWWEMEILVVLAEPLESVAGLLAPALLSPPVFSDKARCARATLTADKTSSLMSIRTESMLDRPRPFSDMPVKASNVCREVRARVTCR
jgi:hypothetical protein